MKIVRLLILVASFFVGYFPCSSQIGSFKKTIDNIKSANKSVLGKKNSQAFSDIASVLAWRMDSADHQLVLMPYITREDGKLTELSLEFDEMLTKQLAKKGLDVVEKNSASRLTALLDSMSLFNNSAAKNDLRLLGIRYLISGSTIIKRNQTFLNLDLIDVKNGTIVSRSEITLGQITDSVLVRNDRVLNIGTMPVNYVHSGVTFEDEIFAVKTAALAASDCTKIDGLFGEICFENLTKENLILYEIRPGSKISPVYLPANQNTCPPKLPVKADAAPAAKKLVSANEASYTFLFKTTDKTYPKFATITLKAIQCMRKSVILNPGNLFFRKKE